MPGRARLRVPRPRTPERVRRVAGRIERGKHVRHVTANPATGSVLLSFAADDPIDIIIDDLRLAGLEILSQAQTSESVHTQSSGAALLRYVLGRANARLHMATRGHIDIRIAVPALYLLLAVRNFTKQRGRLRDASWYQLLYWAFDSFFKLHEEATVVGGAGRRARIVH